MSYLKTDLQTKIQNQGLKEYPCGDFLATANTYYQKFKTYFSLSNASNGLRSRKSYLKTNLDFDPTKKNIGPFALSRTMARKIEHSVEMIVSNPIKAVATVAVICCIAAASIYF